MAKCEINDKILDFLKDIAEREIAPMIKHEDDLHIEVGPFHQNQSWNSRGIPLIKLSFGDNTTIDYVVGQGFSTPQHWKATSAEKIVKYINDTWIESCKIEIARIQKRQKDIDALHSAMTDMGAIHCHPNTTPKLITNIMNKNLGLPNNISDKLVHYYILADDWSRDQILNQTKMLNYWDLSSTFKSGDEMKFKMLVVVVREDENKFKLRAVYSTKQYNYASMGIYDNKWYVAKNIMRHLGKFAEQHQPVATLVSDPGDA